MDLTPVVAFGLAFVIFLARIYVIARRMKIAAAHPENVDKTELRKAQAALKAYRDEPKRQLAAAKRTMTEFRRMDVRALPSKELDAARALLGRRRRFVRTNGRV